MLTPDPIYNYGPNASDAPAEFVIRRPPGSATLEPALKSGSNRDSVDWYFRIYTGPGLLGLSYMQMMLFGTIAAALSTILMEPKWGKAIHRFGCKPVMKVCMIVECIMPLVYVTSVKGSFVPMLLMNLIGAMFWCGANLSASNMQLNYSPDETRSSYIAVFACVTALVGTTLGSLSGGALLDHWSERQMFTGFIDRYKVLFMISSGLRLLVWLLLIPRLEDDSDSTAKDVLKMFDFRDKLAALKFNIRHSRKRRKSGKR